MITSFGFTVEANPHLEADIPGTIDQAGRTILLKGPLHAEDVTGLRASFTTTGREVSVAGVVQESGVTENDFSGPLTYRVTAEYGLFRDYLVHAAYWKHPSVLIEGISPMGVNAYYPQAAMYDSSDALIVWQQGSPGTHRIFKSEYRDRAWSEPETVSQEGMSESPQVVMSDNGDAVIAWYQGSLVGYRVFISERRNGTWSEPTPVSQEVSSIESLQAAMSGSGNAVILWLQGAGFSWQLSKSEYRFWDWED
ncbi:MAG: hypothetical protein WAR22_02460 [Desulfomonilia bacterium]|jgi:hypothetical protein|nr:hypothetical protein [Deltaproteobacteria bacterium]